MKNYIIVAIVIILIIAGVVWYSNKGAVAPVDDQSAITTENVDVNADATAPATDVSAEGAVQ
ncbi:MAG: hypothetical protein COX02_02240 [Candidatus Vogelbacteria bacterium CG22_combo_CG10-13_8_21_14_all_37_9]|uniref:Uncharacterized protein n=1 Tax=Candidatus Vogelbacteria bacterium CG22_combo_CG10-13_8_21_14_all_37_9 TaxID=1975046 RepID=A0A2H0BKD4_9BACT|nr:MAG: hypothetical protein BK005_01200 [bacterium CG10_37_50]PIP58054.1 MAG: hypothetical protein COX02_02240 [Candidatus Vogelbacteria bacterium CG22_combo_CG10-13_8_21_14_all_37_9]